ncbi:MAG: S41 family peptidase [Bacteroidota bacterium]
MKKYIRIISAFSVIALLSGFVMSQSDTYLKIAKSIDIFGKVYKEVTFNYVDAINPEEFMISGINGMLAALDPYTVFIDEKRKDDLDLITDGKYGGVGVSIGIRNDRITIVDLIDGYSAQRQGIRIGDVIESVNGIEINKDNFDDISSLVKGEPGTQVVMTILRDGGNEKLTFNLVREEIRIRNLTFSGFVPENSNNVYMKLTGFSRTAGEEMKKALIELSLKKDIKSIVLDLRGNPGGLLDAAVDVCEKFLNKGQLVVSVMGRDTATYKKYYSQEEPLAGQARLAVLVDNSSASASEIVAGAIQDHDRGIILGTNTFGKGLVQTIIPLSYNTSLKITTAKYYTPSGRCIQKIDYSKSNKVIGKKSSYTDTAFTTDRMRHVYSAGGIKPDTIVSDRTESSVVRSMLAGGVFFRFANTFSNHTSTADFRKITDDELFGSFQQFLKKEKFDYTSEGEKRIGDLLALTESEKYNQRLVEELTALKKHFRDFRENAVAEHRSDIILMLKSELSSRYEGLTGRIRESLNYDKQFLKALDILNNQKVYNHLLLIK